MPLSDMSIAKKCLWLSCSFIASRFLLGRVGMGFRIFPSPRLVALPRLKSPSLFYCLIIDREGREGFMPLLKMKVKVKCK